MSEGIPYFGMPFLLEQAGFAGGEEQEQEQGRTMERLQKFFEQNPRGALAFSGGVDSALLVWAAARFGQDWRAYYVRSDFQPAFELRDARQVAEQCGLAMEVLEVDALACPQIAQNPSDRCYHCKKQIFSRILSRAQEEGYTLLIDGSNASDDAEDRPGMRALQEMEVRSPLREAGLTKAEVRRLSKEAGLPTWDKPAYACLATRIPTGTPIAKGDLQRIERGEEALASLGFRDFRLRLRGGAAVLQIPEGQQELAFEQRREILQAVGGDFPIIALDLAART